MESYNPSEHEIESFKRFMKLMPQNADLELTILKGHLLIEEQLRAIIKERIKGNKALELDNNNWSFYHVLRLSEALCHDEEDAILWKCIAKLNKIRNDMAHNLEPKGLNDRVDDLNEAWPSGFAELEKGRNALLDLTLWSIYTILSGLVKTPSAKIIQL